MSGNVSFVKVGATLEEQIELLAASGAARSNIRACLTGHSDRDYDKNRTIVASPVIERAVIVPRPASMKGIWEDPGNGPIAAPVKQAMKY